MLRTVFFAFLGDHSNPLAPPPQRAAGAVGEAAAKACPAEGVHWERVGFQGADPRTDLNRSMGILAVLQALRWADRHPRAARDLCAACAAADRFGTNTVTQAHKGPL